MKVAVTALISVIVFVLHGTPPHKTEAINKAPSLPVHSRYLVPPSLFAKWEKVAWCEHHGNWQFEGIQYDGGLGIMPYNWRKYGGLEYASLPHLATPYAQVLIADRIQGNYEIPDQHGYCEPW